jgi:hypothetical protein
MARVDHRPQRIGVVRAQLVDQATLRLRQRLARVELRGRRIDAARVGLQLGAGQAQRILRRRQFDAVADEGELGCVVQPQAQLQVLDVAPRRAVRAPAVGLEVRDAGQVVQRALRPGQLRVVALLPVAAAARAHGEPGRTGPVLGEHLDHPARGIAVQRRERAAQHLDRGGGAEVDVGDLALPVGHRRGDAVHVQPHAADAEGRARAEAAHGDLHVLRVVLPVAREQARHAAQGFGQIDAGPRVRVG